MSAMNKFREAMRAGKVLVGGIVTFSDPLVSDAMAEAVDFLWLDLEHCPMSPEVVAGHLMAGRAHGVPTHVRVPAAETAYVKHILDLGGEGIILPLIMNAQQVQDIIGDCRYPPLGCRGIHPRVPGNYGRGVGPDYLERANRNVFVTAQIETVEACEALEEILAVPTLDSVLIGTQDLSGAMGYPGQVDHPEVVKAVASVAERARAAGLFVGMGGASNPEYLRRAVDLGVQWIQCGADYLYITNYADRQLAAVRELVNS